MKKNSLILLSLMLMETTAWAQLFSMDSIVYQIENNNPELQMYDAQIKAMDTYAQGTKAWEAPQVGAGFFMTPYNPSNWKSDGMGNNGMGSFMIQGQQMITNPAKLKANEKYMKSMSSVEASNKRYSRNLLVSEAKMNYTAWMILKKKQKILLVNEELMNYIIKTSEIRYPYEQEKLNTIYKAKATLMEIKSMQLENENEIELKRIELNRLMNRDKSIRFDIDTAVTIKNYEADYTDTSSIAASRSDVQSIEKNILLNKNRQKYEWSKRKPDFGIQYAHMFSFGQNPNLFTLMGMVSIPIVPWSSSMYKSTHTGLSYQKAAYEKQKEYIVNETAGKLSAIKTKIANKKSQLKLYKAGILPALEKNYRVTLLAYEQNTENLFVVLDARQSLQMANMEYLNQLQELLLLQVTYEKETEKN